MKLVAGMAGGGYSLNYLESDRSKRADMILVKTDAPHAIPMYNVVSQMVYALKGSDVNDVMVNGRIIVKDRRVLTLDAGRILAKAREYRQKIAQSVGLR